MPTISEYFSLLGIHRKKNKISAILPTLDAGQDWIVRGIISYGACLCRIFSRSPRAESIRSFYIDFNDVPSQKTAALFKIAKPQVALYHIRCCG